MYKIASVGVLDFCDLDCEPASSSVHAILQYNTEVAILSSRVDLLTVIELKSHRSPVLAGRCFTTIHPVGNKNGYW